MLPYPEKLGSIFSARCSRDAGCYYYPDPVGGYCDGYHLFNDIYALRVSFNV